MNRLSDERREVILKALCMGASMRGLARSFDISINTATKLLVDAGKASIVIHSLNTVGIDSRHLFCLKTGSTLLSGDRSGSSNQEGYNLWTWVAFDALTGLIASFYVGDCDQHGATALLADLAVRLAIRPKTPSPEEISTIVNTTDKFQVVIKRGVSSHDKMLLKSGMPEFIPMYIQNILQRKSTRLRNAYSRSAQNFYFMVALAAVWHNYIRLSRDGTSRAMRAGLAVRPLTFSEVVGRKNTIDFSKTKVCAINSTVTVF